jgi:hypothetical protein
MPRPFLPSDLLRDALVEGLPVVLARWGLDGVEPSPVPEVEPVPEVAAEVEPVPERKQSDWPSRAKAREQRAALAAAREDGVSKALDFAAPLIAQGIARPAVCAALNAAGLLNTAKGNTPRPWQVDALARALARAGGPK